MFRFSDHNRAKEFHYHMIEYSKHTFVLGDDSKFWIVTNRQASC